MIVKADGTALPILTGQPAGISGISNYVWNGQPLTAATVATPVSDSKVSTNYYLADSIGTAQVELTGDGWPVWQGQFTPFGEEIDTQATGLHYKYAGLEQDAESGQEHAQYRQLSVTVGRWTSPDPFSVQIPSIFSG